MKCYQHRQTDAIGVCKTCGKALCPECAVDLGFAVTCRGDCEQTARANHQLNANAAAVYSEQKKSRYIAPTFFSLVGVVFVLFGWVESRTFGLAVSAGLVFMAFGLAVFMVQRRLMRKIKT